MNLNPFKSFGLLRVAKRIADELARANVLKEAELDALTIPYPARKHVSGKDAEIEVSYSDTEVEDLKRHLVKEGLIARGEQEEE